MHLRELLHELRSNILHDRSDQVSGASSDYLWDDATLVRYINEAQRRFARRSLTLRDGVTPEVCQVKIVANQNLYPLHKSVLGVISIRLTGDQADLARAGHSAFDTYRIPDNYYFDPGQLSSLPPGKVVAFSTDESLLETDHGSWSGTELRVYPMPDAAHTPVVANLRVVRLPLRSLHVDSLDAEIEIAEDHQLNMLDWAAYLALRGVDLDVAGSNAVQRAQQFMASFEAHILDAKGDLKRKTYTPLQWGFGRNGFTWEN